jgi:hypothetical protein
VFPKGSGHRADRATFVSERSPLKLALASCSKGQTPQMSPAAMRSQLQILRALFVVVSQKTAGAACANGLFEAALGTPRQSGGVMVWSVSN